MTHRDPKPPFGRKGSNFRDEWKAVVDPIRRIGNLRSKAESQVDRLCGRDMAKKKGGIKFTILPLTPDFVARARGSVWQVRCQ